MPTASNTVNKMDVEDPFIISDAIGIASSQQGKIVSLIIKHASELHYVHRKLISCE